MGFWPYRTVRELGSGGQGVVLEVEQTDLGRLRAMKVLLGEHDEELLRAECRALGAVEHPNVVQIFDSGMTPEGRPFFVMEHLVGESLAARLDREGCLEVLTAVGIAKQVLQGLAAAHRARIVHRDLNPGNVFLTTNGAVKLIDFGFASLGGLGVGADGSAIGTPRYMSPEQALGGSVDAKADLYAVGQMLFEMLTGEPLFPEANTERDQMIAGVSREARRLSSLVDVPRALDELVEAALSKDPALRPATAEVFAAQLQRATVPRRRLLPMAMVAAVAASAVFAVTWHRLRSPTVYVDAPPAASPIAASAPEAPVQSAVVALTPAPNTTRKSVATKPYRVVPSATAAAPTTPASSTHASQASSGYRPVGDDDGLNP